MGARPGSRAGALRIICSRVEFHPQVQRGLQVPVGIAEVDDLPDAQDVRRGTLLADSGRRELFRGNRGVVGSLAAIRRHQVVDAHAAVLAHAGSSVQFQARARVTAEDGATRVDGSQRSFKDVTGNQVTVRGTPALGTGARTSLSLVHRAGVRGAAADRAPGQFGAVLRAPTAPHPRQLQVAHVRAAAGTWL